jgi:hypothetical protein
MKKEVAKIFKSYGEGKIEMIRGYKPKTKAPVTTAIRGSRMDINRTIGSILLSADKEERKLVGNTLIGEYFEDWDSEKKQVIKY